MNDEQQNSNQSENTKKPFFQSLFGRFFQGELKNREELVEVIRDSEQNDLIDQNTRGASCSRYYDSSFTNYFY